MTLTAPPAPLARVPAALASRTSAELLLVLLMAAPLTAIVPPDVPAATLAPPAAVKAMPPSVLDTATDPALPPKEPPLAVMGAPMLTALPVEALIWIEPPTPEPAPLAERAPVMETVPVDPSSSVRS